MIAFITNVAPIMLGFVGKLFALKSQAAAEQQKLMIQSLQVRNDSINMARDRADKESPMAAMNRRIIILVILALIIFTQIAPVFFDVHLFLFTLFTVPVHIELLTFNYID